MEYALGLLVLETIALFILLAQNKKMEADRDYWRNEATPFLMADVLKGVPLSSPTSNITSGKEVYGEPTIKRPSPSVRQKTLKAFKRHCKQSSLPYRDIAEKVGIGAGHISSLINNIIVQPHPKTHEKLVKYLEKVNK